MAEAMNTSQGLSLKINKVLNHLGLNDEIISYRRKCKLEEECNENVFFHTRSIRPMENFYFGSQWEGTTTDGINSDLDYVSLNNTIGVLTNSSDQVPDDTDYTFQMDKFTEQGYCCLRDISFCKESDLCKSLSPLFTKHHKPNTSYLMNSFYFRNGLCDKNEREGPAFYLKSPNKTELNYLKAFFCTAWPPTVSDTFLISQTKRVWPSDRLVEDVLKTRCFVVPKGSDNGPDSNIEWRLSFSFAERLLMFDLNIVQIRCYVLMKYVKITFLDTLPGCKGIISSYICKTALFHTVSQTPKYDWTEVNLFHNFNKCLCTLQKFVNEGNCPHFIMPMNNLLGHKLDKQKKENIAFELQRIIDSKGVTLFDIKIDKFGELLRDDNMQGSTEVIVNKQNELFYQLIEHLERKKSRYSTYLLKQNLESKANINWQSPHQGVLELDNNYSENIDIRNNKTCQRVKESFLRLRQLYDRTPRSMEERHCAIQVWKGIYSTLIGSLLSSADIKDGHQISDEALACLHLGMESTNVASTHLKLASIMFLIGNYDSTRIILDDISAKLDNTLIAHICQCKGIYKRNGKSLEFSQMLTKKTCLEIVKDNVADCVVYSSEEVNSCPKELQYEMYRTAFNKKPIVDIWSTEIAEFLYFASLPQLPFLYFMKYKLYKQLGMAEQASEAMIKLINPDFVNNMCKGHMDTILNLIGQCLEQEGKCQLALRIYYHSLKREPVYNAAKILICCNLVKQFNIRNTL
ncbi:hypothetical protein ACF0H5_023211 [Mactra antiquata]